MTGLRLQQVQRVQVFPVHLVQRKTWTWAAAYVRDAQRRDGGFSYQPNTTGVNKAVHEELARRQTV